MNINELSPVVGSTHVGKRKGRGHATGNGKTAGRGHKGQKARSGGGVRIGFEGGQMPLARRIPKRGFHNIFAKPLESVNVSALEKFEDGAVVDAKALLDAGILSKCTYGVKILGNGEITKKLTVKASAFSESAKAKIEAQMPVHAGGTDAVIGSCLFIERLRSHVSSPVAWQSGMEAPVPRHLELVLFPCLYEM